ncbi:MAG: TraR/DksA family transcriptional regulator [Candidatus Kapaibacterium sp.]
MAKRKTDADKELETQKKTTKTTAGKKTSSKKEASEKPAAKKPAAKKPAAKKSTDTKKAASTSKTSAAKSAAETKKSDAASKEATAAPKKTAAAKKTAAKSTAKTGTKKAASKSKAKEDTPREGTVTEIKRQAPKVNEPVKEKAKSATAKNENPGKSKADEQRGVPKDAPKVKYSDEDLEMFREVINRSRQEALEELRMLKERLEDLTNYDFAEESMIYSMHMAEQGSEAQEKEKTYAQIQRINEYIKKLDDALSRIKEKTYGICRVCGCLIAKERLLAVPITTLSASYKIHQKCPEDGIDRIEPVV